MIGLQLALVVVCIAMSIVVGEVASRKGYSKQNWAMWGLIGWPIALPIILNKPSKLTRRCADCGSTDLPYDAPVCRHCGRDERKVTT